MKMNLATSVAFLGAATLVLGVGLGCSEVQVKARKPADSKAGIVAGDSKSVAPVLAWSRVVTARMAVRQPVDLPVPRMGINPGVLSESDLILSNGGYVDLWSFEANSPTDLLVTVTSRHFDTHLMVFADSENRGLTLLAENDDDRDQGTNSMTAVRPDQAGTIGIAVTSYAVGGLGEYELRIESLSDRHRNPSRYNPVAVLAPDSSVEFEFRADNDRLPDGTPYRSWLYFGRAGERLTISMSSVDFDTYVVLGRGHVGSGFETIAEDDDGGAGTDSRLSVYLPEDGTYTIVANSVGATGGAFALTAESGSPPNWADIYPGGGDRSGQYALLVGISDYPGSNIDLDGPREDAAIVQNVLVTNYGFRVDDIVMLQDREASRDNIAEAFLRHLGQAGPNGVAVFFFSGHGSRLHDNIGVGPPWDAEANGRDEALVVWGNGDDTALILDDEMGFLADRLATSRTLLVIDACFSGTASRGSEEGVQAKAVNPSDLVRLRLPKQVMGDLTSYLTDSRNSSGVVAPDILQTPTRHVLLAASLEDELSWAIGAWPDHDGPASVFTYFLQDAIADLGPSATFENIHAEVSSRVAAFQRERRLPPQSPQLIGRERGQSAFSFLVGRGSTSRR